LDFSGNPWFWNMLATISRGSPTARWYAGFAAPHLFPRHLALAMGLLFLNSLGVFAILAPILWLIAIWRRNWHLSDSVSLGAVAVLFLMTFGVSANATLGLPEELIHRPFVWAYWLVASLTAGRLFAAITVQRKNAFWWPLPVSLGLLLAVPFTYGRGLQRAEWQGMSWHYDIPVDIGFVESARFIRAQPPSDAVIQDSNLDEPYPALQALSERGSFAARPKFWLRISRAFRESSYKTQLALLSELQSATDMATLRRQVRESGIRWYLVRPGTAFPWPKAFYEQQAFQSQGYKVYDMQQCFDL
jgi:hypothetical protein